MNIAAWDRGRYLGALMYDTAKSAIVRATATLAHELRPHGVNVVAVFPGFTTTERVQMAGATGTRVPRVHGSLRRRPRHRTRRSRADPAAATASASSLATTASPTSTAHSRRRSTSRTS